MTASEPDKQPQGVAGGDGSKENKPEADKPEECSWCKWMKGGGCKKEFEVWLKCVDDVRDAGRDDVESCAGLMGPLWDCMQHNSAYYSPQLDSLASRKPERGRAEGGGLAEVVEEVVEGLQDFIEGMMEGGDVDVDIDLGD